MDSLTSQQIYNHVFEFGSQNSDPEMVARYARYFKEDYDAFGLKTGLLDKQMKELLLLPGINYELVLETTTLLVSSPKYEMAVSAFRLVLAFKKQWDGRLLPTIETWFPVGIRNWALTDYLCAEIMNLLFKKKLIDIKSIETWRTSPHRFQRRAALVSLIKPMKLDSQSQTYLEFLEPMMHDKERVVHQGLGWLLREIWKKYPEPVEDFLMKYKDTAARLIFQYATEKMTPEQKSRFRKSK